MEVEPYNIKWHNTAKNELRKAYNYYLKKSIQGAENMKNDILNAIELLGKRPNVNHRFEPSLGMPMRYINVRRYKVIYIKDDEKEEINILGIFDTKEDPQKINKIKHRN